MADSEYALIAEQVFDGERILRGHAVRIRGDHIVAVDRRASLDPRLPFREYPGACILPGLVDAHVHLMRWQEPLFLASGVTTVRDVGNALDWVLGRRAWAVSGSCPRILCTGPLIDGPRPNHPQVSLQSDDAAQALEHVRALAASGVDGIKLYVGLPNAWLPALVSAAHGAGLKVCMHALGGGVLAASDAGVDELFHLDGILADAWPDHPPGWLELWGHPGMAERRDQMERVADRLAERGVCITPTLAYWESQVRLRRVDFAAERDVPDVPAQMVEWQRALARGKSGADVWERALERAQRFVGSLVSRGARILAGTDVPCGAVSPGRSLWRELALLAESGMEPLAAFRAATSAAADFLGRPEIGRIRPGSQADLAIVEGDPFVHIPVEPAVIATLRGGVELQPQRLREDARQAAATLTQDPWSEQWRLHAAPPRGA